MKRKKLVDIDAKYYQNHSKPQYDRAQELVKNLSISKSDCILDVGCGHGTIIAEISKNADKGHSIGIDASSEMINLAKKNFPKSKFKNLAFQCVKAEEMHFEKLTFDVIISFSCLLWVRNPKKALELMCKYLKPGGTMLILTYLKESAYISFLERALSHFPSYQNLSATPSMLTFEDYQNTLQSQNLKLEEIHLEWRYSKYKSQNDLKDYLRGWVTCFAPIPMDLQESFLEIAVNESLKENISTSKNEIVLPYKVLSIKSKKLDNLLFNSL
jgi:ubiquinone/menaquinone biosynthesis C-methylase UbiE